MMFYDILRKSEVFVDDEEEGEGEDAGNAGEGEGCVVEVLGVVVEETASHTEPATGSSEEDTTSDDRSTTTESSGESAEVRSGDGDVERTQNGPFMDTSSISAEEIPVQENGSTIHHAMRDLERENAVLEDDWENQLILCREDFLAMPARKSASPG